MISEMVDYFVRETEQQGTIFEEGTLDGGTPFEEMLEFARSLGKEGEELVRRLIAERGNGQSA